MFARRGFAGAVADVATRDLKDEGMTVLQLDHIAVSALTLEEGRDHVEAALGVSLQPGGVHAHFGTHNMLLGLEDGLYLEVIAIDPSVASPPYARWFDLDRFAGRARPTTWICRTDDLAAMTARFDGAGAAVDLARGDLRWQMAVPQDGILPFDGLFPALIQWRSDVHPATRLTQVGCALRRLIVSHPQAEALEAALGPVLREGRVVYETGPAGLRAEIGTPHGLRVLE